MFSSFEAAQAHKVYEVLSMSCCRGSRWIGEPKHQGTFQAGAPGYHGTKLTKPCCVEADDDDSTIKLRRPKIGGCSLTASGLSVDDSRLERDFGSGLRFWLPFNTVFNPL